MPSPVSRAEFARLAGVSAPAITKASKGQLAPACIADRIDLDHPAARAYLAAKGKSLPPPDRGGTKVKKRSARAPAVPTEPPPKPRKDDARSTAARRDDGRTKEVPIEKSEDFERYKHLTLEECRDRFGTFRAMRDIVEVLKKIEDTRARRLQNDEREGHLVSRELVKTHIVGTMYVALERLLRDTPRSLVLRLYQLGKSDGAVEDGEKVARDLISSTLKPAFENMSRSVRKLEE